MFDIAKDASVADEIAQVHISSGLETALSYMLCYLRRFTDISFLTVFIFDKEQKIGISIDASISLKNNAHNPDTMFSFNSSLLSPRIQDKIGKFEKMIIQNVSFESFRDSPPYKDFITFHSFARFPLFEQDDYICYLNMYSETANQFYDEIVFRLEKLCLPLSIVIHSSEELKNILWKRWRHSQINVVKDYLAICPDISTQIQQAQKIAPFSTSVLITGETGVGKEVIADIIQHYANRKGSCVKVNCAAIPEELIDSFFFGHEKGAFTGAFARHIGYFEQARNGILFLDEIGELSLLAQARLLRVLDEAFIQRVGGTERVSVSTRIIAATNRDLPKMIQDGTFRQDLWYRLAKYVITIPPLRERKADILSLTRYFIEKYNNIIADGQHILLPKEEQDRLLAYSWPGNVRELEFLAERAIIESTLSSKNRRNLYFDLNSSNILPQSISSNKLTRNANQNTLAQESTDIFNKKPSLQELEAEYIQFILHSCEGRIMGEGGAGSILGIHPQTLYRKLRLKKNKIKR